VKLVWDKVGAAISGLCVIHCVLLPIGLLLLPALSTYLPLLETKVHLILLGLVLAAAGMSFIPGYRVHKHLLPLGLSTAGITSLIFAGTLVHDLLGHRWEPPFAILGSLLLIVAHWVNHSKCKSCVTHTSEHSCGRHHDHGHSH